MPNWSTEVPTDPRGYGLPLVRTPALRSLKAIITSHGLIGCDTHYWGGHTVPCAGAECEACEDGNAYRWHAYLSAYNPETQLHFVFECTAQAAKKFKEYWNEHKTLRGCLFEAYRWKHVKNGRVIIKCVPGPIISAALPNAPDLANVMAIVWRLKDTNVWVAGEKRGFPRVHADKAGNGQSSDPRDYVKSNP